VILKCYFDGGNEANSLRYDRITLATTCGTDEQWTAFESEWNEVLARHKAPFLHTTDAVSLQQEFSAKNGWTRESVGAFIIDCVAVIENHLSIPGPFGNIAKPGLHIVTLTIPLDDYRRAKITDPKLPNSVTEICTSESLGFCFKWGRRIGAEEYHLYFDQGEPFYGHVYDRRHNRKSKKAITPMDKVIYLGEADMRVTPALQLADLFAWCINHNDAVTREWHGRLHSLPWDSLYLDYSLLLQPMPGALERTETWNLPKRRATL
jgi:hypothetical protein